MFHVVVGSLGCISFHISLLFSICISPSYITHVNSATSRQVLVIMKMASWTKIEKNAGMWKTRVLHEFYPSCSFWRDLLYEKIWKSHVKSCYTFSLLKKQWTSKEGFWWRLRCRWCGNWFLDILWWSWDPLHRLKMPMAKDAESGTVIVLYHWHPGKKLEHKYVTEGWYFFGRKASKNGGEYSKTHGFFPVGARCSPPEVQHGTWKWWSPKGIFFPRGDFQVQCLTLGV